VKNYDGDEPTGALQMLVNQDMEQILAYGQDHPDHHAGRWLNRDEGWQASHSRFRNR
jgi:hypothetical protein